MTEPEPMSRNDKVGVLGTFALFTFIMVGIYGGFFTAIEAAWMGAFFVLVLTLIIRVLSLAGFAETWRHTILSSGMIFTIIVVVVIEISLITPPVGMNTFVLRSLLNDISLTTIFRAVLPFWLADILRLALLLAFPVISVALLM